MAGPAPQGTTPGRHVYDVIVLGGQIGGILTTALLAKRGLHVLHVPHDGLGTRYAHGELKLPHAPFLLPPIKLIPSLDGALQELGLSNVINKSVHVVPLQLLEQERWFELNHDEKRRGPELARVFGNEAETFDELMRRAQLAADSSDSFFQTRPEFPPASMWARWKFKRLLANFPGLGVDSPLASDALVRKLSFFVAPVEHPGPLTRARTLGRVLAGPAIYSGGREGFWQVLAERARELGADVLGADESVERLVLESRTVAVRLTKTDTLYRGVFLVAGMDLETLTPLMPEKTHSAVAKMLPTVSAQKSLFTLNLVLAERALPRGLGALALVDAPTMENGVMLIQISAARGAQRVVSVSVVAPLALKAAGEPAVRALISQIHAELARVMPFTKSHIALESTPWLDAPSAPRAEAAPLFPSPPDGWLRITGVSIQSPWKRVLLASRQVFPGLGLEGEVLAARMVVKVVEESRQKALGLQTRKRA